MPTYILQRLSSSDKCTLGVMKDENNVPFITTLELPWLDNKDNISCIPAGIYECERYKSPKRGYVVFLLKNVPDRDFVEIHIGNFPKDTDGCILIGMSFMSDCSIGDSRDAFSKFMNKLEGQDKLTLKVVDNA
jgi:hypothetical protein